jgi:hypothetical protein
MKNRQDDVRSDVSLRRVVLLHVAAQHAQQVWQSKPNSCKRSDEVMRKGKGVQQQHD